MITLALQIFLLLLAAYLAGCMFGCLLRRALHEPEPVLVTAAATAAAGPAKAQAGPLPAGAERFETALTGRPMARTAHASEPIVEVRPRPAPQPPHDLATAEIEIVRTPSPPPTAEPAPAAEATPVPIPQAAPVEAIAEPEPLPPPPPPPPSEPAPVATYAAAAAAAAVAAAAANAAAAVSDEPAKVAVAEDAEPAKADAQEPVVPAPEQAEAIAPAPAPPAAASAPVAADDLKRIRSIDRALEERLQGLGVSRFAEIAAWTAGDVARASQSLGLVGRIEQENWIEQAQILARGSDTDYSRRQALAAVNSINGTSAAVAAAAATATAQKSAAPDRFTRIIGVDPTTEQLLYGMGFTRYSEIAQWAANDVERVEAAIGKPGRVGLDNWIEQARVLARYAGDTGVARPLRLADAIRENRESEQKDAEPGVQRQDVSGLRSVRSQALRGEAPAGGERQEDLKRIRGVGVLIERRLNALGIRSYEQIANWTKADIDSVSAQLDFKGRIERENWIEQARILASGGQTEFSRRVDRGEVETSKDG